MSQKSLHVSLLQISANVYWIFFFYDCWQVCTSHFIFMVVQRNGPFQRFTVMRNIFSFFNLLFFYGSGLFERFLILLIIKVYGCDFLFFPPEKERFIQREISSVSSIMVIQRGGCQKRFCNYIKPLSSLLFFFFCWPFFFFFFILRGFL